MISIKLRYRWSIRIWLLVEVQLERAKHFVSINSNFIQGPYCHFAFGLPNGNWAKFLRVSGKITADGIRCSWDYPLFSPLKWVIDNVITGIVDVILTSWCHCWCVRSSMNIKFEWSQVSIQDTFRNEKRDAI